MKTFFKSPTLLLIILGVFVFPASLDAGPSGIERARAQKIVAVWQLDDKAQMDAARAAHLDVLEFDYGRSIKFLTDERSLAELRARGYTIEIEIPDVIEFYASRLLAADMGGYRTFDEIVLTMDSLHDLNPAISTARFSIGQTIEGREMWVMKISDNPEVDEDEPESFFDAAIHAREVITPAVLLESMRTLIEGYGVDTMITRLVDTREIFFMPCFNADGYAYNAVIAPSGGGMWRKNRRDNDNGTFGVDLNRNFPFAWGYDNNGSSPVGSDNTYRGSGPNSEPEVQNYINFVESREFAINITFHAYSNLILWPYGYDYDLYSPDEPLFAAMGETMAGFNGYLPMVSWGLYPANGTTDDWMYGEQATKDKVFSFTFEVGNSQDGFWPSLARVPELIAENIPVVLWLIDASADPYRTAPPLAPVWSSTDSFPSGFFELTWSQPDNQNEIVSFSLTELLDPQVGIEDAETGDQRWRMDGFTRSATRQYEGASSFHSKFGSNQQSTMTTSYPLSVTIGDTLEFYAWYEIETDWDYAYLELSTSAASGFVPLAGNLTTNYNPHGNNRGNGITGFSPGWVLAQFDLSPYAGEMVYLRLSYHTDAYVEEEGLYADLITPIAWFEDENVLAEANPDSSYSLTTRPVGDYYFQVRATDSEGQAGPYSAMKRVYVEAEVVYGDLNDDIFINPIDVVWLVGYVYQARPGPLREGAQYIDGDSLCNPVDVVWLVNHVYRAGPPPLGYSE